MPKQPAAGAASARQSTAFEVGQVVSTSSRIFGPEWYNSQNKALMALGNDWRKHRCYGTVRKVLGSGVLAIKWQTDAKLINAPRVRTLRCTYHHTPCA